MKITLLFSVFLFLNPKIAGAQSLPQKVSIIGQMKDVMWKGDLQGKIYLDTISNRASMFGIGPVENLSGEILLLDGTSYHSKVVSATEMKVEVNADLKAPFFGYAAIAAFRKITLPATVLTLEQLEKYLIEQRKGASEPILFKLSGLVEDATIHIVNLPPGTTVRSPQDAHQRKTSYQIKNEAVDIVGFFSTDHKGIFTHHDTFLHLHLITRDRKKMGHLDALLFTPDSAILYLPAEAAY